MSDEFSRYVVMEMGRVIESSSDRDEAVSIASAWKNTCCVLDAHEFKVIYRNDAVEEGREWTVLGHYSDTGDTYCQHVLADNEIDAAAAAVNLASEYCRDTLIIDFVIRGTHEAVSLSNEGKGVYAEDVLALKLGEEFNGLL